jgi:hypothetical protein
MVEHGLDTGSKAVPRIAGEECKRDHLVLSGEWRGSVRARGVDKSRALRAEALQRGWSTLAGWKSARTGGLWRTNDQCSE